MAQAEVLKYSYVCLQFAIDAVYVQLSAYSTA